jgi:NADH-quinone oxidoreductase subunit A
MASYLPILVFTLISMGFLVVSLLAAKLLRHRSSPTTNLDPYECGNETESYAHDHRFSIRYYLIAVLFVIFDVETIFLFPWAVIFDRLPLFLFVEMSVFLAILITGYVYIWNRGALRWV